MSIKQNVLFVTLFLLVSPAAFAKQKIIVNLSEQKAYAMDKGTIIFEGRISSGKPGRRTPNGNFKIIQKKRHHKSNLWPKPNGGAKMPYMMRLTNTGYAMHLGYIPGYPASHGCVRLENNFAQKMYKWAKVGTPVSITGKAPKRSKTAKRKKYVVQEERYVHDEDEFNFLMTH